MDFSGPRVPASHAATALTHLLAGAVKTLECDAGAIYGIAAEAPPSRLAEVSNATPEASLFSPSFIAQCLTRCPQQEPAYIASVATARDRTEFGADAPDSLAFVMVAGIHDAQGVRRALLVLGGFSGKPGLSPAQHFVLGALGKQFLAYLCADAPTVLALPDSTAALQQISTERLRLLESAVNNARDSILITEAEPIDLPGPRIVYCNPAFTKTTGYAEADVIGLTPRILHGPETDRAALDTLKTALRKWRPIEIELLNYRKDGTPFWVELSIVPVADETGWFTHWVSVQRDTTERKEAEAAAARVHFAEREREVLAERLAERQRAQMALVYAATHDELTQLHNRAYVIEQLNFELEQERGSGGALLYLDLDGFKLVNDSLGHAAGDALLIQVADRLQHCLRPEDVLARFAGDEFVILIRQDANAAHLESIAHRIREALQGAFTMNARDIFVSCSIGIVRLAARYETAAEVLRDADTAMYAAKRSAAGGFLFFEPAMHERALQALSLQSDLRDAVRQGDFTICYQPIFDTHTRAVTGVEALIRWTHVERGPVPPDVFIPIAERMGLIGTIDRWVRESAIAQLLVWQQQFPALKIRLNVNVSALNLRDQSFLTNLEAIAQTSGFDLSDLQIEITEGLLLADSPATERLLVAMRKRGVKIALDDFGTGFSSLSYIDRYPIDTIKIDRTFVTRMLLQTRTMSILRNVISLAKDLDLDVVAEGVENEAQYEALAAMGCSHVQGYLFCKPLPAPALAAVLACPVMPLAPAAVRTNPSPGA
ncbi:EAL domain-containing protein [Robbsia sp. Bb-Pol-6]|uniref:EAL domain-containing protein n=1 Tax=Robbsia betulipollinis TaxID=2981849 RepID=A0ABT3ZI83_9BURK|nr:EAL domain-containing protein [Robbsia betulipollinis]MCY0386234.1 EAL domain-containing protein [Robbsia betulipollinis]